MLVNYVRTLHNHLVPVNIILQKRSQIPILDACQNNDIIVDENNHWKQYHIDTFSTILSRRVSKHLLIGKRRYVNSQKEIFIMKDARVYLAGNKMCVEGLDDHVLAIFAVGPRMRENVKIHIKMSNYLIVDGHRSFPWLCAELKSNVLSSI